MSQYFYAPTWPVLIFDPGLSDQVSNPTPIPPPPPPAPTLTPGGFTIIQYSNGTNVSGGLVRLYDIARITHEVTLMSEQPFAPVFDWAPWLGNSFFGFCTEVGNDAVYSGESPQSNTVQWAAP